MTNFDLHHRVTIRARASAVYHALTTQAGHTSFWTVDCLVEPVVGSVAEFRFFDRKFAFRMRVDALEPPRLVGWSCLGMDDEWLGTRIRFELAPDGTEHTLVHMTHAGWRAPTPHRAGCNFTWGQVLGRLREHLETGRIVPYFTSSGISPY